MRTAAMVMASGEKTTSSRIGDYFVVYMVPRVMIAIDGKAGKTL